MLLRQRRLTECLDWIAKHEREINKIEKYQVRLKCLKVAAIAFAGEADRPYRELPRNFRQFNEETQHFSGCSSPSKPGSITIMRKRSVSWKICCRSV